MVAHYDSLHNPAIQTATFSVSIVVYDNARTSPLTRDPILATLLSDLAILPACERILVLDNSPERIFAWASEVSEKVVYIHFSGTNLGYGRANNIARFITSSKYHLVCNPDIVFLDPEFLSKLLTIMEEQDDLAMIQPLIVSPDGEHIQRLCKRNPTFFSQIGRGLLGKPYKAIFATYEHWYEMRGLAYADRPIESEYLSGCFMLCRRRCLDAVNWFDPRFFMYLEDADLTRRLSAVGRCVHEPRIRVGHIWGKGSHRLLRLKLVAINSYFIYGAKWGFQIF